MTSFDHLARQLEQLSECGRLRSLVPRRCEGPWIVTAEGRRLINFGGNDYLGFASQSLEDVAVSSGASSGSGASALVCGWTEAHQDLAETIARFEGTEAAVLFPSGYAACSGTVATLAGEGDLILSDRLNHASLIDGCRLSRAACLIYRHRDCVDLEETLVRCRDDFERVWIVTDGVFSMDGHVAPLRAISEIAARFDATLIVDEAHGTGVLGDRGTGVCESLGVKDRVPVRIGTLSKAIGSQGGFVAGPRVVIDYLINRCRSLIFSTALAPGAVAAARLALEKIRSEPERRSALHALARMVRGELGIEVEPPEDAVPIIPVILGDDRRAVEVARCLEESGFYVPAIRPPTVPEGTARLRISLSAAHQPAMVQDLLRRLMDVA